MNDYGARASRDLIVTRGAGFRKEKNKKKRGVSIVFISLADPWVLTLCFVRRATLAVKSL